MRLRENQRKDQYQDRFILGGIGIGAAMGVYTKDWENIKGYVAWCTLAGLLLSATVHWAACGSSRSTGTEFLDRTLASREGLRPRGMGDRKELA
jgi:hypothetical protein